jgi:hypothetical protein
MKSSATGILTLQNAAQANGNGNLYPLTGCTAAIVCVSGTFNADIHIEVTSDGSTWHEIAVRDMTTTNANDKVKKLTGVALIKAEHIGGALYLRTRIAAYSSGAVTVRANGHA